MKKNSQGVTTKKAPRKSKMKYAGPLITDEFRKIASKEMVAFYRKSWKAYKQGKTHFIHDGQIHLVPRIPIEEEE